MLQLLLDAIRQGQVGSFVVDSKYAFAQSCKFIFGALRDLVPFAQFKKREKLPWRSVTFLLKVTLLYGCFSSF